MADYACSGDILFAGGKTYPHKSIWPMDAARTVFVDERVAQAKKRGVTDESLLQGETELAHADYDAEVQRLIAIGSLVEPASLLTAPDLAAQLNAARDRTADLERQLAEFQALRDGLAPSLSGAQKGAPATAAEIVSTPAPKSARA